MENEREPIFEELKANLGQAIDYAEGKSSKARTKKLANEELATFSAQDVKEFRL